MGVIGNRLPQRTQRAAELWKWNGGMSVVISWSIQQELCESQHTVVEAVEPIGRAEWRVVRNWLGV
jgi:hypothetical protein